MLIHSNSYLICLSTGQVPNHWKHSNIIPIPKTSPPSSSPSDYHPVYLLSFTSKLLEKHIFHILLDFSFEHSLISENQFGFLRQRSTTSALLSANHSILSNFNSRSSTCGIFLDLRKDFDSVPHEPMIDLLTSFDLSPHLLVWIHSYLSSRTQSVLVNNAKSPTIPVLSGVHQVSILGPLLFLLYINEICNVPLSSSSVLLLYAGDILLLHPCNSLLDKHTIQTDVSSLHNWLASHFLSPNPSKSKYMFFSLKPQANFDFYPELFLHVLF